MSADAWLLLPFALVGVLICGWSAGMFLTEIHRAARQGRRVAAVLVRLDGRRRASLREWFRCFKAEIGSNYDKQHIGIFTLSHDPSKPIRRRWRYHD